jgi:hypothetical protein
MIKNTINEIMLLYSFVSVNAHAFICDSEINVPLFLTRSKLANNPFLDDRTALYHPPPKLYNYRHCFKINRGLNSPNYGL